MLMVWCHHLDTVALNLNWLGGASAAWGSSGTHDAQEEVVTSSARDCLCSICKDSSPRAQMLLCLPCQLGGEHVVECHTDLNVWRYVDGVQKAQCSGLQAEARRCTISHEAFCIRDRAASRALGLPT